MHGRSFSKPRKRNEKSAQRAQDAIDGHEELLTVAEAAALFDCSTTTIVNRVRAGTLPRPRRLGRQGRFLRSDLLAALGDLPSTGFGRNT